MREPPSQRMVKLMPAATPPPSDWRGSQQAFRYGTRLLRDAIPFGIDIIVVAPLNPPCPGLERGRWIARSTHGLWQKRDGASHETHRHVRSGHRPRHRGGSRDRRDG